MREYITNKQTCCKQKQMSSEACHVSGIGRRAVGVVIGILGAVFGVFVLVELLTRPVLNVSQFHDTPGMLLAADAGASIAAIGACVMLLMPECCCENRRKDSPSVREDFRRERNTAALLLVVSAVIVAATVRIRDVNVRTTPNEHQVCGRRGARYACPTQRVLLNADYVSALDAEGPGCWLNTSSAVVDTFTWGEELSSSKVFPTADFSSKETYEEFTEYASCFYFGCSETCTPDSHAHNSRMLHWEAAFALVFVMLVVLSLCVALPSVQYSDVVVGIPVRAARMTTSV